MKRIKVVFKLLILFAAITIPLHSVVMVKADSGWDSSYGGGGGSSFGGSSYSYGGYSSYSWGSSSVYDGAGNGQGDPVLALITTIILFIIFGYAIYEFIKFDKIMEKKKIEQEEKYNSYVVKYSNMDQMDQYHDISEEQLQKCLPGEDLESLKSKLFNIYKDVQIAWMNFEYDKLKELCTDELATTYIGQLEMLKVKKGQNIMSDWSLDGIRINKITDNDGVVTIYSIVDTRFYDYVINIENGLVNRGYKNIKVHNIYNMEFVVDKRIMNSEVKCPKCGATVIPNKEGKCEYCRTVLSNTNDKIVLSKKNRIN